MTLLSYQVLSNFEFTFKMLQKWLFWTIKMPQNEKLLHSNYCHSFQKCYFMNQHEARKRSRSKNEKTSIFSAEATMKRCSIIFWSLNKWFQSFSVMIIFSEFLFAISWPRNTRTIFHATLSHLKKMCTTFITLWLKEFKNFFGWP